MFYPPTTKEPFVDTLNLAQVGQHRVTISFTNNEDGKQFGLEKVWTGTVTANEVTFTVEDNGKRDERKAKFEDFEINTLNVSAVLDEIDAKNRTISVTIPKRALKGKIIIKGNDAEIEIAASKPTKLVNLPVAKDAMFTSGTKQIKIADLKLGMHVTVQLSSSESSQILVRRVELSKDDGFQDIEIEKKDKR